MIFEVNPDSRRSRTTEVKPTNRLNMSIKKIRFLVAAAGLTLAGAAHAQPYLNGNLGTVEFPSSLSSSYTGSSFTLATDNLITSDDTDLAVVPLHSDAIASLITVSGLSTSPTPEDIDQFLLFSSPGVSPFTGPGTTPVNRFDFILTSITDVNPADGDFSGTGIFHDYTGGFSDTAGTVNIDFFSSPNAYSITLSALGTPAAVPEPSTLGLLATGLAGAWTLRRRKN